MNRFINLEDPIVNEFFPLFVFAHTPTMAGDTQEHTLIVLLKRQAVIL